MFLGLTLARADVPGSAVSAAGFGAGEEQVHVRLDVRLLPPQVRFGRPGGLQGSPPTAFAGVMGRGPSVRG